MTKFVFALLASLFLGEAIQAEELNVNSSAPTQQESSYNQDGSEPTREIARRRSRRRRRGHRRHRRHYRRW